ncbi:alpha/beta fold hydrolase [Georgenia sp. AZ-5]|uniref:alpha/beta fold hydrolase n=1 Tax=Georgenia sp. AZ-5 TaxID=3367526 RepID=UPI003755046D
MASLSGPGETMQVRGCGLRYWNHGDGGPVVLTHGAGTDHSVFDSQAKFLLDAGYRIITWDLRGHGLSRPWDGPFDPELLVDDLAELLDRLAIVRPVLVGHGLGGHISQAFTRRRPEHVRGLVVIGAGSDAGRVTLTERLRAAAKKAVLHRLPAAGVRRVLVERSAVTRAGRAYAARAFASVEPARLADLWTAGLRFHDRKRFYRTPVPLCLVRGEHDRTGIVASSMRRWAPRELTRQVVVPDAGHLATVDAPEAVNAVLNDFLQSLKPQDHEL